MYKCIFMYACTVSQNFARFVICFVHVDIEIHWKTINAVKTYINICTCVEYIMIHVGINSKICLFRILKGLEIRNVIGLEFYQVYRFGWDLTHLRGSLWGKVRYRQETLYGF